jgi:alkaline phosphatase D
MKSPLLLTVLAAFSLSPLTPAHTADFASNWSDANDRIWIGPEYWANPLQDWHLTGGRVECRTAGANRSLFLLTHEALPKAGGLKLSVRLGKIDPDSSGGGGGIRVGIEGTLPGYRNAAIHGRGLDTGITGDGVLFIGNQRDPKQKIDPAHPVDLVLTAEPQEDQYILTLTAAQEDSGQSATLKTSVPAEQLTGYFALFSNAAGEAAPKRKQKTGATAKSKGKAASAPRSNARFWFQDWKIAGSKLADTPDRTFGPVLWTQYTLSRGTLKMTAFLPPVGKKDSQSVALETKGKNGWKTIATETLDALSRTVLFRIEDWNSTKDTPYRVIYSLDGKDHEWAGTIRKDPVDQNEVSVAGFTGNTDYLFPNARIAANVAIQNPDVLFFSGDQIYESVGGFGVVRSPVEIAALDYLRKYWLFGWAFGDLMRDRPSIALPDDHDVYQGNIWGHNGRSTKKSGFNDGGFGMDPEWVNMVNRTQTGNLPDPVDPDPLLRDISVYFTDMTYGGVSFAIIEDRKFKSGPGAILSSKSGRADHVRPEDIPAGETFDPLTLDVPEARLLGQRQLDFIRNWAQDWSGAEFKCALSQTIFANLANFHGSKQEYLIADLDSNGWPQSGRNRALHELRRGFAFMYAGDQHLSSIVHHGINHPHDAGVSFCVPSIAAGYPRAWRPEQPWPDHEEGAPDYTGNFKEGLGNRVTVHAIGNPEAEVRTDTPENQGHDKASGHGIVRFNKADRTITMECWRLLFDANKPTSADQFPGWPRTISLEDNYGRDALAYLPTLKIKGMKDPVIHITEQSYGDIVYTLRIKGDTFRPKVFDVNGSYSITVGEPGDNKTKTIKDVRPTNDESATLEISL